MVMKTKNIPSESMKLERKTVERNRRIQMKGLCFKLASLVPHQNSNHCAKEMLTQQDQLDLAASYITHLKDRIENLKMRKEQTLKRLSKNDSNEVLDKPGTKTNSSMLPLIELKDLGCCIEVILISNLQKNFMLCEVISVLEQEGAEVVSASFSIVGGKIFHSIHAQVKLSRVGVETTRVRQRLEELIY